MTLCGENLLRKTVSKDIGETKKLLRYLGIQHIRLENYKGEKTPLQRNPKLKPEVEYCALE